MRLRRWALLCNFPNLNNVRRDQFVCEIQGKSTHVEHYKLTNSTYDIARKNAAGASRSLEHMTSRAKEFQIATAISRTYLHQEERRRELISARREQPWKRQRSHQRRLIFFFLEYTGNKRSKLIDVTSAIFKPNQGIPLPAASKVQRWAISLSGFQYEIVWVKLSEN